MPAKFIPIKEVSLNNHCPECYSKNGLQLTFKQKFIETSLYKSVTQEIEQEIICKTCNTIIYPVNWTKDIDQVFEYQKKAFIPKKASIRLKRRAWVLISSLGLLITILVILAYFL